MIEKKRVHPEIKECVDRVLRCSGSPRLPNGFGIDVEAIIQNFGQIEIASIPNLTLGGKSLLAAYVRDLGIIMVEHHCNAERRRFSLAHELGHSQLESNYGDAVSLFATEAEPSFFCDAKDATPAVEDERSRGRRRRTEIRANQFAAALLMPEGLIRELRRDQRDGRSCAALLGVSIEALTYRLTELSMSRMD